METLPHPDNFHAEAVLGWLMLDNPHEAALELEKISLASRRHPDVLEIEWSIYSAAQQWDKALQASRLLIEVAPDRSSGWIHQAYSLRRVSGGGLAQAWEALRPAADKFPNEPIIPYNLACYAAQMKRLEEAWDWLQKAMQISGQTEQMKTMALADADLESLWERLNQD
jgi:tetratricopeptide (TPR) repeat protein